MRNTTNDNGWKFAGRMFLYWLPTLLIYLAIQQDARNGYDTPSHIVYGVSALITATAVLLETYVFKHKRYIFAALATWIHPLIVILLYWIDRSMLNPETNGNTKGE